MDNGLLERLVTALETIAAKMSEPATKPTKDTEAVQTKAAEPKKKEKKKEKRVKVVDKTEEKKPEPKKEKKKEGPDRTEVTRMCKDYRKYFGADALIKLWGEYDAESLNDIPEDKYEDFVSMVVHKFQKRIIKLGKKLPLDKVDKLKKEFGVERLMDAKSDYPNMLEAIEDALGLNDEV
jgi:hypothetical protein